MCETVGESVVRCHEARLSRSRAGSLCVADTKTLETYSNTRDKFQRDNTVLFEGLPSSAANSFAAVIYCVESLHSLSKDAISLSVYVMRATFLAVREQEHPSADLAPADSGERVSPHGHCAHLQAASQYDPHLVQHHHVEERRN